MNGTDSPACHAHEEGFLHTVLEYVVISVVLGMLQV